jgi:hypothetical protein
MRWWERSPQNNADGFEETRAFWTENGERQMTTRGGGRSLSKMPPHGALLFYNGNTFVAIIRDCITHAPGFSAQQVALARSLAGHMVAGTAEPEEIRQFDQLLNDVEQGISTTGELQPGLYTVGDRVQTPKGTLTGKIVGMGADGSITWKCDQTGSLMTGTSHSLKPHSP